MRGIEGIQVFIPLPFLCAYVFNLTVYPHTLDHQILDPKAYVVSVF